MKIRTQFIISTVVLGLILLLVSAAVIVTNQRVENTHQQEMLATQIERQAYELGYLADDYLLYRESQQASRWEAKFASFSNDLSNLHVNTPEQQALLANIQTNQRRLKNVFAEVRASIESAQQTQEAGFDANFIQISWSRLQVQNQGMIFDASRLEEMLREDEDLLRRMTGLLSLVLVGVLGTFLLGNYGLIFRRTLQAIAELQAGTRIIGSGDLDFAIPAKNEDEIGELSRAFNQMTASLKQVTASKADLEKEIMERNRAEEALRESESRVRTLYATMTEGLADHEIVYEAGEAVDYIITDVNPAYERITGFPRSEAVGRKASELYGTGGGPPYLERYARVAASGVPEDFETYFPPMNKHFAISVFSPGKGKFATLFVDITERKRVEEQLESERGNLQMMFNAVNVGMLLMGEDGSTRQVNNVVAQWTGKTPSEVHGFQPGDVLGCIHVANDPGTCGRTPQCSACSIRNTFESVLRSGQPVHNVEAEATLLLNGKEAQLWLELSADPLVIDGKQHAILALNDITTRKRAETELVRLASFPERNPNPVFELGYSGGIAYINPKTRELFPDIAVSGLAHPILAGLEHLIQKFKEGDLEKHIIQEVKAGNAYYHQTIVNIPESGRIRLYNLDITERKQAEEALLAASLQKQASQYARTLIEVSIDPLVTISPEGKITDVNEATIKATGMPREELVGTNFSSYFTEPEKAEQAYRHVFAWGFVTDYPLTIRHRDGHLMDVFYNASLYKDTYGSILGAFAAARDVTALKRAESELRRHKENLEALVKERTSELEESNQELARSNENLEQFAYVASHDLQEPLRIMSSYSQLLERRYKGRLDQDADEFIAFIVDAAARMQKLITDLLAYSRAGRGATDMVEVNCDRLVRRLVAAMAPTIESADGHVTFDGLPSIMAHESSLVQLFQNLIGNALKFRGEQPPRIHLSASQAGGEWVFSVRDNGIGIEPQYSQRIFMIFQRLHARDKYPGTGIGLSICKKIVETLGGRIWIESEPGQGSTFYFTVPIRKE